MNSQELETAKRIGVNFTTVIFNDNDYGLISWKQRMSRNRSVSTRISNPDFKAYVESFGITAYQPKNPEELKEHLYLAITSHNLTVVEVPVDTSVNDGLIEKLQKHWG